MFMDENAFDEVEEIRSKSKFSRPSTASNSLPEDDEAQGFGSAGTLNSATSSRARMLAQQREIQMKKRQSLMQNTGMVRSSIDSTASGGGSPVRSSGQFTPAVRQFSAPKHIKEEEDSEFNKQFENKATVNAPRSAVSNQSRTAKYSDDEEEDRYNRRDNRSSRREEPRGGRNRDYEEDDDYNSRERDFTYNAGQKGRESRDFDRGDRDRERERDQERFREKPRQNPNQRDDNMRWENPRTKAETPNNRMKSSERDDDREHDQETPQNMVHHDEASPTSSPARVVVVPPDLSNMRNFLANPVSKKCGVIQCYIKRNKSGTNKLFPVYSLFLKEGDVFLMSSRKRPKNKTSNYLISMDQHDLNRAGPSYLGKLRSNFMGTEFQVYDDGVSPKDTDGDEITGANSSVRCEMGSVMYAANVLGSRGPRKMQVALPGLDENGKIIKWRDGSGPPGSNNPTEDLLSRMRDRNLRDIVYLINKPPRWNDQVGAYVLNFNGRVTMASVKNFQLVDPEEQNAVVLQFGRVGKDEFTMDLQWPISPFQAFAVTLSSFDSKIACD